MLNMEIRKTFLKKDYHFVCESHKAWHGFQSNFSDFPVFAFCDDRNDSSRTFDVETSLGLLHRDSSSLLRLEDLNYFVIIKQI
jgi:hypothetical protein